jgi:hypothetical protein
MAATKREHRPSNSEGFLLSQMIISAKKRGKSQAIHYFVVVNGKKTRLQPGKASRTLARLYEQTGASTALLISGCNGYGSQHSNPANRYLTERLQRVLRGLTPHIYPGTGVDSKGQSEPVEHFLALGLSEEHARTLGRDFGQASVIWAEADTVPRKLHPLENDGEVKLAPRIPKRTHRVLKFRRLGWWLDPKETDVSNSSISQDKINAYRATHYRFAAHGAQCALYVGFKSEELEHLYRSTGTNTCVYITAFNPLGQTRGREENLEAQKQLKAALAQHTPHIFYGEGVDPGGAWAPEPSFLALGVTEEVARELATRFAQDAVVWAEEDAVPKLILMR